MLNLLFFFLSTSFALTPTQIVHRADIVRAPQQSFLEFVNVENFGGSDEANGVFKVSVKNQKVCLVEQIAPERLRGRKLLMKDENLWFWTPTIKRPTRVSFEQRLTGEVANGDLTRTAFADDYSATLVGRVKVNGHPAYKIHLQAKTNDVTYSKIDYEIAQSNFFPLRAEFFALSGKLLKTATYTNFRKVFGRPTVTRIVIQDFMQKNHRSILTFSHFQSEHFSDSLFNKETLNQ